MFQILVVEDNANTRKLMETVLLQNGYQPVLACDGVEALEVLDKKHIDLIVLDIMMPRMDGYEFTETLRASGCDLPILMVTAKEKPADKRRGFIIGTDDYMVKPVDEEEMILRIAALLRRSKIVNDHQLTVGRTVLDKPTFGSRALGELLAEENQREAVGKITLIGLCTDICVISNALLLKAFLPEAEIAVDAACCAGVTPQSHRNALAAMQVCQITVENGPKAL